MNQYEEMKYKFTFSTMFSKKSPLPHSIVFLFCHGLLPFSFPSSFSDNPPPSPPLLLPLFPPSISLHSLRFPFFFSIPSSDLRWNNLLWRNPSSDRAIMKVLVETRWSANREKLRNPRQTNRALLPPTADTENLCGGRLPWHRQTSLNIGDRFLSFKSL